MSEVNLLIARDYKCKLLQKVVDSIHIIVWEPLRQIYRKQQTSQVLMVVDSHHFPQRHSILPSIPRYSEQRIRQSSIIHNFHSVSHHHHLSNTYLNSDRDFTTSKSLKLKSQRNHERRLLHESQKNPIFSLQPCHNQSIHQKQQQKQQHTDKFNIMPMETFSKQTKTAQFHTKNSLMSKILSHHKQINKINFQDSRSQLFGNFHKTNINLNQNFTQSKPLFDTPNKIVALLNDRPFRKSSPLKYNISKLKMMNNIKKLAQKNSMLEPSSLREEFEQKNEEKSERLLTQSNIFTSNFKNNRSMTFLEKSFIKTDFMKQAAKSFNKLERYQILESQQKSNRKRSLLKVSDDEEKSQKDLDTIVSELSQKCKKQAYSNESQNRAKATRYNKKQTIQNEKDKEKERQNRQLRCQQRILSDLLRLEQMRNKQCYAQNKVLRLKSTRMLAQNIKQIKLQGKDKDKLKSHKIKYLVKFKTQPRQNPKEKLQVKLRKMIPEIEALRNKLMQETKFEGEEVNGVAHPLKERVWPQTREKVVVLKVKEVVKDTDPSSQNSINRKSRRIGDLQNSLMEKEVSGWEINQVEGKEGSWNFRI